MNNEKEVNDLQDENDTLKARIQELEKLEGALRFKIHKYQSGEEFTALKAKAEKLVEALNELKHHNNHSIDEEMWRIDQALKTWNE